VRKPECENSVFAFFRWRRSRQMSRSFPFATLKGRGQALRPPAQRDFQHSTAEDMALKGPYVLVTSFICIHDMAYPVKALRKIREITAPDGAVLIGDMAVSDNLSENYNFWGRFCYNASVLHCLPQSMVFPDSAATGTLMGPGKLQKFASEAGFRKMEVLSIENPFWRFYRLTP